MNIYVYTRIYPFTLASVALDSNKRKGWGYDNMHTHVYTGTCVFTPAHVRLHQHIYVYTNFTEGQVLATLTEPGKEGVSTLWKGTASPNITFTPAHVR